MENIISEPIVVMPVERKDGTCSLRLCLNQGELTPGMMKRVMEVMVKYGLSALRATTGQRMNLEGIPKDRLEAVVADIGGSVDKAPPSTAVCPGATLCKFGKQATRELGDRLLAAVKENGPYPFKVKSGISGCGMGCGLSFIRDVGLVGGAKGWDVRFGGSARDKAGPGLLLGSGLDDEQALQLVGKALAFYRENGKKRERTSAMLRRLGEKALREAL